MAAKHVTIQEFAKQTGLSVTTIRRYIAENIFIEGIHWRKLPVQGEKMPRQMIDTEAYDSWVEQPYKNQPSLTKSNSPQPLGL